MTAKEWLIRGWQIGQEIEELAREKEEAFARAAKSTAGGTDFRVQGRGANASEERMAVYADYSILLEAKIEELIRTKTEILEVIGRVENAAYRTFLQKRYISFKKMEDIADEMYYSLRHTRRIQTRAVLEVEKMLKEGLR